MSANDARVDAVLRGDVGTLDAIVDDFYGGDAGKVRDATETRARSPARGWRGMVVARERRRARSPTRDARDGDDARDRRGRRGRDAARGERRRRRARSTMCGRSSGARATGGDCALVIARDGAGMSTNAVTDEDGCARAFLF